MAKPAFYGKEKIPIAATEASKAARKDCLLLS